MKITKIIWFDAGHRVPNHKSQCRNLHWHRYTAEITLEWAVILIEWASSEWMVMDFSDVKNIAKEWIDENWDHAFIVYWRDEEVLKFLQDQDMKHYVILDIPTVENLAKHLFEKLDILFQDKYNTQLQLQSIKMYETPTSFTIYEREKKLTIKYNDKW